RVEEEIKKNCRAPQRLFVVLIKKNTESVIEAAAVCEQSLDPAQVERAIKHKRLLDRDAIFIALSRERARPQRDCVLGRMPPLPPAVELLARILGAPAGPEPPAGPAPPSRPRKRGKPTR